MELAAANLDDPYERGKKLTGLRNMAATPLLRVHNRGRLQGEGETEQDAECRLLAGERFRQLYERAELGGSRAIDYSAVKVDTSFAYRGMNESAGEAMRDMGRASRALGEHYPMIRAVIGEEVPFLLWTDRAIGRPASGMERLACYARLREALDALVELWGVARGKERGKMRAEICDG